MSTATVALSGKMKKLVLNHSKEYVLVNVGPRPVAIGYGGNTVWVPPGARGHAQIEREDAARPHKLASHKNPANGKYIPGTIVIRDIVKVDKVFGSREVIWDAAEFIMERIGENCEKEYGKRGIAWALPTATMEDLAEIMREAYPRWYASEIKDAKSVLAEEESRLKVASMRNIPATAPSDDVIRARAILAMEAERTKKSVADLMKGFQIDSDGQFTAPAAEARQSTGDDVDTPLFDSDPDVLSAS
jgi:hypothetical protein